MIGGIENARENLGQCPQCPGKSRVQCPRTASVSREVHGRGGQRRSRLAMVMGGPTDHRFLPALRSSSAGYPRFLSARPIPSMTRLWILHRSWKAASRNASYTGSGRYKLEWTTSGLGWRLAGFVGTPETVGRVLERLAILIPSTGFAGPSTAIVARTRRKATARRSCDPVALQH
jgi:hypothetical protein